MDGPEPVVVLGRHRECDMRVYLCCCAIIAPWYVGGVLVGLVLARIMGATWS